MIHENEYVKFQRTFYEKAQEIHREFLNLSDENKQRVRKEAQMFIRSTEFVDVFGLLGNLLQM